MFDKDDKKKDNQEFGMFSFMNDESDKDNDDNTELTEWQKEEIKKETMIHGILKKKMWMMIVFIQKMMKISNC